MVRAVGVGDRCRVACALPIMAEAVSWGGGSSTLGNAAAIGAFAATEAVVLDVSSSRQIDRTAGWSER